MSLPPHFAGAVRRAISLLFVGSAVLLMACSFHPGTAPADAPPDVMLVDAEIDVPPSAVPRSCAELHTMHPDQLSGMYSIDPDGPDGAPQITVRCDMSTAGGGWTLIFLPMQDLAATSIAYTVSSQRLLDDAEDALLAFRDSSLNVESDFATLPFPAAWKSEPPFDVPGQDEPTNVSINGGAPVASMLRYGYESYANYACDGEWNSEASPIGRVCVVGTLAPFYGRFATTALDGCSDSTMPSTSVRCDRDRRFTIAVR